MEGSSLNNMSFKLSSLPARLACIYRAFLYREHFLKNVTLHLLPEAEHPHSTTSGLHYLIFISFYQMDLDHVHVLSKTECVKELPTSLT